MHALPATTARASARKNPQTHSASLLTEHLHSLIAEVSLFLFLPPSASGLLCSPPAAPKPPGGRLTMRAAFMRRKEPLDPSSCAEPAGFSPFFLSSASSYYYYFSPPCFLSVSGCGRERIPSQRCRRCGARQLRAAPPASVVRLGHAHFTLLLKDTGRGFSAAVGGLAKHGSGVK